MKHVLPILLCCLLFGCASTPPELVTEYEKVNDQTITKFWPPIDVKTDDMMSGISMYALFTCKGTAPCHPSEVRLNFRATRKTGDVWTKNPFLRFVLNGKQFHIGEAKNLGDLAGFSRAESLWFTVSPELFIELAHAETVEGSIGETEFSIPQESRTVFQQLAAKMGQH